jgi:hypothetical protein
MENPNFLHQKYKDFNKSPEVDAAAKRKDIPLSDADARIQSYLDRLDAVINPLELEDHSNFDRKKRNLALLKKDSLYEQFIIKPEEIPEAYFKSIKKRRRREGCGDIKISEDYRRELEENVINDQKRSLDNWVDYLASDDAKYPDWLKYFAFRSILRMGIYDKQKKSFGERTGGVVAPFPDLNREALAITLEAFECQANGEQPKFGYDIQDDVKQKFLEFLKNKNFAKLYALTVEEFKPIAEVLLKVTKGEWRPYPAGSDPKKLVESIAPYGTGWCIRGESTAKRYLVRDKNTLHVFYSLDQEGKPTVPRVVMVVNAANQLTEVRGVAYEENLDECIGPVVEEKLKEFPDGELFTKKTKDMKFLTEIDNKVKQGINLNKEDLVFLYELDSEIKGFGYQKDPRIKELLDQRNPKEDMLTIFDYAPEQIAHNQNEINENTVAYLGEWSVDVFQIIREYSNVKYFYESFSDKKIFITTLETDPEIDSPEKAEKAIRKQDISLLNLDKDILNKTKFSKTKETYDLVRFSVKQLGFPNGATTDEIYRRAEELGLELCPAEVGPQLRLQYHGKGMMWIAMKQITDSKGNPCVFYLNSRDGELELYNANALPSRIWPDDRKVVFRYYKKAA